MWSKLFCTFAMFSIIAGNALADTIWTGAVSDSWFDANNWDIGVPEVVGERAQIESTTDLANWPVVKNGETVNLDERIQMPKEVSGSDGETQYGRLTIESGGAINVNDDFRAGDDDGTPLQPMVGSLVVAGTLTLSDTARFGDNDFMTLTVDVTGSMISLADDEDFRIGTGDDSNVQFNISGNGLVSVAGPFELDDSGLLSLSENGTLTLFEHTVEDDDIEIPITKADIIDLIMDYVDDNLMQGLTNNYSGGEVLTVLGNGVAYFEGADNVSFVAIPEPAGMGLLLVGGLIGFCYRSIKLF